MPITWQNVTAPSNDGAMRGFAAAGQNFDSAFDKLGGILKGAEAAKQYQVDQADEAKVLAVKEKLANARTPEDVLALTGELNIMKAGLTNKGRTAVLGAEDARTASLQQQITARNVFNAGVVADGRNTELGNVRAPVELANAQATSENSVMERALAKAALTQRGALQPIDDARGLTTAKNLGRAADFTATQAPQLEANQIAEARAKAGLLASDAAVAPTVAANRVLQVKEDAAVLENTSAGRRVDAIVAAAVADHQGRNTSIRTGMTEVAKGLPAGTVPMNSDGTIALNQMDATKRALFNKALNTAGLPPVETLETGDTRARDELVSNLQRQGFSPAHIARVAQGMDFSLNTGPTASIGVDRSIFDRKIAERQLLQTATENQYGVRAEPGNAGELLKGGLEAIDSVIPADKPRSEIYKERLGKYLQKGGIELKDPKTGDITRIMPNADQVRVIVTGIEKNWHNTRFGWLGLTKSGMQEEIDTALEAWGKSPEALKGAAELQRLDLTKQLQVIRQAEEKPPPLPPVLQKR